MDKSSVMVVCVSAARETIHGKMYMRPNLQYANLLLSPIKQKTRV